MSFPLTVYRIPIPGCVPRSTEKERRSSTSPSCYQIKRRPRPEREHRQGVSPNRKIFEARKRETAALGAGEKLVLGHPLAATIGDSARRPVPKLGPFVIDHKSAA